MNTIFILIVGLAMSQQDTILNVDDQVDKFAVDFNNAINAQNTEEYKKKKAEFDEEIFKIQEEV